MNFIKYGCKISVKQVNFHLYQITLVLRGDIMIGIKDIAKLANVSPSTVSNVLNNRKNVSEETRERILSLCKEYNYEPNLSGKNLKDGKSKTVLFNFGDFDRQFYLKIIQGISDYIYSKGYDLLICTNKNCERYMNTSLTCGCIMLDVNASDSMIIKKASKDYPIVVLDRLIDSPYVKSILVNNYTPQKELVEGLVNKGCRRFAYIGGVDTLDNKERYNATCDALKENGLSLRRDDYYVGDFREKSGYQAAKLLLLTEHLPDALVCANDDMAMGALKAFKENNVKIPEDISITGFDDTETAQILRLTTIHVPNYERGYISAQYLIDAIEGEGNFDPFKISAKVKWRKTSI